MLKAMGPHVPHPPQPEVTHGTEHTVLQEQSYHLPVLTLTPFMRQAKDYTDTQRQDSITSQGRRTRRCTGKIQNHGDGERIEVFVQGAQDETFRLTQVPWDVPLTWSLCLDEMMSRGFPRPPGLGQGGHREGCLNLQTPGSSWHMEATADLLD